MRWFLLMWFAPMSFLALWLGLASNDINFGMLFFSRALYDHVFGLYAAALGVAPETLPPLVVRALVLDSLIVLSIFAFRRRRAIAAWFVAQRQRGSGPAKTASLSSAP
ncbi:DUF6105 family protein [Aureimonas jatrophae]|uniref:Uncharacterized protein n=1 Tax=Aureimonas jatrophae TaxID=1166073 RepID=A0A1H0MCF0_9HYPH|nr:DUF6105 family protein [Aureimonas jatrophae]MBB3951121.1 hypothetical protein [Aureimonas jatrophae]SDO78148.1 hypothetical protein SAMN05192530_11341 [Aureimonas jatrophae]